MKCEICDNAGAQIIRYPDGTCDWLCRECQQAIRDNLRGLENYATNNSDTDSKQGSRRVAKSR